MTDEEVARHFKVFSHLDVGDCAWHCINSYRPEQLHLEASFAVPWNGIGYVPGFPLKMEVRP